MHAHIRNTETGLMFTMRLVRQGDKYGRNHCLTHDEAKPLVEFYDSRFPHDHDETGAPLGQFVSRYYADTLLQTFGGHGLCLDAGIRDWALDGVAFTTARQILRCWTQ